MNMTDYFDLAYAQVKKEKRSFRIRRPRSNHDLIFGFVARVFIGIAAIGFPIIPLFVWGWFTGWIVTSPMIAFYAGSVLSMVLCGEHLRSRIFERVINSGEKSNYVELRSILRGADTIEALDFEVSQDRSRAALKRGLDIVITSMAFFLLSPLLIVIAILVKLGSPGPVLVRILGFDFGGGPVWLYRFRTVRIDQPDRITREGAFLRSSSLEDLPNLFQILAGNISLIGPRPLSADTEFRLIPHNLRFIKPGLVDPVFLEHRNYDIDFEDYAKLLAEYSRNWTLFRDLKILVKTVKLTFFFKV
jgi:exopolysaccharide production protein ExoY